MGAAVRQWPAMVEPAPTVADISAALARIHDSLGEAPAEPTAAAVAAVVRNGGDGTQVLMIHRAEQRGDPWSGQMGLPGGRAEPGDVDPAATAIRETREELALDLERDAQPLGRLETLRTHLRTKRGPLTVTPYVFSIEGDPELVPNHEVQEVLWVPLAFFLDPANRSSLTWTRRGVPLPFPCYRYHGHVVWGLTLRILETLLACVRGQPGDGGK